MENGQQLEWKKEINKWQLKALTCMLDFPSTISTHCPNRPLSTQYLLCCCCCKRETNSSYLCSNSRMDNITPEVDAFCCRVARNVNSLLFRKSWINFSLTWGAAWISLSVSKNFIFKRKKKRGNNSLVKMLSQKDSDHIFHFHINIFHFWESSTMAHHCIFSMKNPNAISVSMPTCHFDKFTTGQLLIFWWIFWQDAEPFVSAASRLSCCK